MLLSDTITECERKNPTALDSDLIPTKLNTGLIKQIKESAINHLVFTSGFGKNNAFKLFYTDLLKQSLTKEIRSRRFFFLPQAFFGRPMKVSIAYSPSGAANISLSKSREFQENRHLFMDSQRPVYDFKVMLYKNILPKNKIMTISELKKGCRAFVKNEKRDALYKTASYLVKTFWNDPKQKSNGLGVLLFTWNHAFYRYGLFDLGALEKFLRKNKATIQTFRRRNILSYKEADNEAITSLYIQLLKALEISSGSSKGKTSNVAVAKALHLLAPSFFPLWDEKIARAYRCKYNYIKFMKKMQELAERLVKSVKLSDKTLLKMIDEYNYAKFTKEWV